MPIQMKSHASRFLTFVEDAKTRIKEIDVASVKAKLDAGEDFYLIDVREESEFARDHLPQSLHLSKGLIECNIEKVINDPDAEIVLYCGGGYRSAIAADSLQKMGYTNVLSMAGGYGTWCNSGYPVTE